jgi:hypothetical protein
MKKTISMIALLLIMSCSPKPEISEESVTRIISTLASDDMGGRMIFTDGIKKASDFIENEFKAIGLESIDGLDGYIQDFKLYNYTFTEQSVMINRRSVSNDDFFFMANTGTINWMDASILEVSVVGPEETIRKIRNITRNSDKNHIFFVDEKHKDTFVRYKNYFGRGARTMSSNDVGNALVILGKPMQVRSISAMLKSETEEKPLNNVVGKISGKRANEIVLFSAHYDHIGIRKVEGTDSIFNGANDNASGTTAVIELARYFKNMGQPERTIMFVAFTAEESGGYGSQYFSQQLNPDHIMAMFNIEMIGKPATDGPNSCWITGFERSTFGEILQKAVEGTEYKFYADPYPSQNLFYRSDNATLARLGVPAHSLSTTPIDVDPDYHKATDHVETLNLSHLANTINAIAKGARTIISGEATPTRVDVSKVN